MSILYDALQKTQKKKENKKKFLAFISFDTLIIYSIIVLLTLVVILQYPRLKSWWMTPVVVKKVAAPLPAQVKKFNADIFKSKYTLNGVFISNDEKVALINDQFFNIGDMIEDMKIVSIKETHIKLQNSQGTIILKRML